MSEPQNTHFCQRSGISTVGPSLAIPIHSYCFWVTQCETEEEVLGGDTGWVSGSSSAADFWLLHDADAAVELALGVVVVDVGVAAAHVGRGHGGQAAAVVGAAVLEKDVRALLASSSSSVGQRRLAAGISTFHVHAVLRERMDEGKISHFRQKHEE